MKRKKKAAVWCFKANFFRKAKHEEHILQDKIYLIFD